MRMLRVMAVDHGIEELESCDEIENGGRDDGGMCTDAGRRILAIRFWWLEPTILLYSKALVLEPGDGDEI